MLSVSRSVSICPWLSTFISFCLSFFLYHFLIILTRYITHTFYLYIFLAIPLSFLSFPFPLRSIRFYHSLFHIFILFILFSFARFFIIERCALFWKGAGRTQVNARDGNGVCVFALFLLVVTSCLPFIFISVRAWSCFETDEAIVVEKWREYRRRGIKRPRRGIGRRRGEC